MASPAPSVEIHLAATAWGRAGLARGSTALCGVGSSNAALSAPTTAQALLVSACCSLTGFGFSAAGPVRDGDGDTTATPPQSASADLHLVGRVPKEGHIPEPWHPPWWGMGSEPPLLSWGQGGAPQGQSLLGQGGRFLLIWTRFRETWGQDGCPSLEKMNLGVLNYGEECAGSNEGCKGGGCTSKSPYGNGREQHGGDRRHW